MASTMLCEACSMIKIAPRDANALNNSNSPNSTFMEVDLLCVPSQSITGDMQVPLYANIPISQQ